MTKRETQLGTTSVFVRSHGASPHLRASALSRTHSHFCSAWISSPTQNAPDEILISISLIYWKAFSWNNQATQVSWTCHFKAVFCFEAGSTVDQAGSNSRSFLTPSLKGDCKSRGNITVTVSVMSGLDSSRSFPLKAKMHLTIACLGMPWVIKQVKAETLLLGTTAKDCCLSKAGMGGQQRQWQWSVERSEITSKHTVLNPWRKSMKHHSPSSSNVPKFFFCFCFEKKRYKQARGGGACL